MSATAEAVLAHAGEEGGLCSLMKEVWHMDGPPSAAQVKTALERTTVVTVKRRLGGDEAFVAFGGAFQTIAADGQKRWEIDLVGTSPKARKQGLGSVILKALLEAGRGVQGPTLARALIRTDNIASQHLFAREGFLQQEETCFIWTSGELSTTSGPVEPCGASCHLIAVDTLLYAGMWVEGLPEGAPAIDEALSAAERLARGQGRTLGTVVPAGSEEVARVLEARGFAAEYSDGARQAYRWWHLLL